MEKLQNPVLFFAFANDRQNPNRFLSELAAEKRDIFSELHRFFKAGGIVYTAPFSDPERLIEDINLYRDSIEIFHFSGHGSGTILQLEGEQGQEILLNHQRLRDALQGCPNLKLVVLNACATSNQAKTLDEIGIPAVIATNFAVEDHKAHHFARLFYQTFATGATLKEAFERATAGIDPANQIEQLRGLGLREEKPEQPWMLSTFKAEMQNWKLPTPIHKVERLSKSLPLEVNRNEFVGRETDLRNLALLLKQENRVLIQGLPGIGKSTLAREYLYRHQNAFDSLAWVTIPSANHDDPKENAVRSALLQEEGLTQHLNFTAERGATEAQQFESLLSTMQQLAGNHILVIEDAGQDLQAIIPQLALLDNWKIIVTSHHTFQSMAIHKLDGLSVEESTKLFYNLRFPDAVSDADQARLAPPQEVKQFIEYVDRHTLTIALIARLCQNPSLSVAKVLKRFQDQAFNTLTRSVWAHRSQQEVKVYDYILEVFDLAELETQEAEKNQLIQWAILPAFYFSWNILKPLFAVTKDREELFEDTLMRLYKNGWISRESEQESFRCHPMIAEVVRQKFPPNATNCDDVIEGVSWLLKDDPEVSLSTYVYLTKLGNSILKYVQQNSWSINKLKNNLGWILIKLGYAHQAVPIIFNALNTADELKETGALNSKDIQSIKSNLAAAYLESGDIKAAIQLQEEDYDLAMDYYNTHENEEKAIEWLAISASNLATTYEKLQDDELLKNSFEFHQTAYDVSLQLSDENPVLITNMLKLGEFIAKYNDPSDSIDFLLDAYEGALQNSYFNLAAMSLGALAEAFLDLSDEGVAEQYCEQALELCYQRLGTADLQTAYIQFRIAKIYEQLAEESPYNMVPFANNQGGYSLAPLNFEFLENNYLKAIELYHQAITTGLKNFDHSHPDVKFWRSRLIQACRGLAGWYKWDQREEENKSLLENAILVQTDALQAATEIPLDEKEIVEMQNELGVLYIESGEYSKARSLFEKLLDDTRKLYGHRHLNVAVVWSSLGSLSFLENNLPEAIDYYDQAYQLYLEVNGPDDPQTQSFKGQLDYLQAESGKVKA